MEARRTSRVKPVPSGTHRVCTKPAGGLVGAEALALIVRDRIPEGLREEALATIAQLSRAEILEPHLTQRINKAGAVKEVSIIYTAWVNEAGRGTKTGHGAVVCLGAERMPLNREVDVIPVGWV